MRPRHKLCAHVALSTHMFPPHDLFHSRGGWGTWTLTVTRLLVASTQRTHTARPLAAAMRCVPRSVPRRHAHAPSSAVLSSAHESDQSPPSPYSGGASAAAAAAAAAASAAAAAAAAAASAAGAAVEEEEEEEGGAPSSPSANSS